MALNEKLNRCVDRAGFSPGDLFHVSHAHYNGGNVAPVDGHCVFTRASSVC
jgi:hypothetical protein